MKFLSWLDGKKSVIAGIVSTLAGFAQAKGFIDADVTMLVLTLSGLLLGVGITHKVKKS
jgi:hypothetical protein